MFSINYSSASSEVIVIPNVLWLEKNKIFLNFNLTSNAHFVFRRKTSNILCDRKPPWSSQSTCCRYCVFHLAGTTNCCILLPYIQLAKLHKKLFAKKPIHVILNIRPYTFDEIDLRLWGSVVEISKKLWVFFHFFSRNVWSINMYGIGVSRFDFRNSRFLS